MIIQKLTIHNIASIEDAVIDFTQPPLADSDIFLISGDTGSGKSTILDAICLALYGTTPRLENTEMDGSILETDEKVTVKDPRRLLRDGAGEGYVDLEFEGTDGTPYKASWSVKRANSKASGRLQGKKWKLENLRTNKELAKDKEIKSEIATATGLSSFTQFCRTTMLAQGQFTRFLNSGGDDKAEIMEKITGADIYARIGKKIYELSQSKAKEYEDAKKKEEENAPLPKEDRQTKEGEKQRLEDLSKEDGERKTACENKLRYLQRERQLKDVVENAKKEWKEAEEAIQKDDFIQKATRVKDYEDTIEVRSQLAFFENKSGVVNAALKTIGDLADKYVDLRAGLAYLKQEKQEKQEQLRRVLDLLGQEKPDLPVIEKAQTVEGHLKTLETGCQNVGKWKGENITSETEISEILQPAREAAKKNLENAKQALVDAELALGEASKAVKDAKLDLVRKELGAKQELAGSIKIAQVKCTALKEAEKARAKEGKEINEAEEDLKKNKREKAKLEQELDKLKSDFVEKESLYNKVKLAEETRVEEIRSTLSEGDICPVCRQKIVSALPTSAEVSAVIYPVREAYEAAKEAKGTVDDQLRTKNTQICMAEEALARRKKEYESEDFVPAKRTDALEAIRKCGLSELTETIEDNLKALSERTDREIKTLEEKDEAGKKLETAESNARDLVDKICRPKIEEAVGAYNTADRALTKCQNKIKTNEERVEDEQKRMNDAKDELVKILAGSHWEKDWESDLKAFQEGLCKAVSTHESSVDQKAELDEDIQKLNLKIETVEAHLSDVEEKEPAWRDLPEKAPEEMSGIRIAADDLKKNLLTSLRDFDNAKEDADNAEQVIKSFLDDHSNFTIEDLRQLSLYDKETVDKEKKEVAGARNKAKEAETGWVTQKNNLSKHQKEKPELEEGDTEDTLQAKIGEYDQSIQDRAGQIALIQKELNLDDQKVKGQKDLQKNVQDLKEATDRWGRLNEMFGSADGAKFRKLAQSYVLGSLVHAANDYMAALTDRYTLKVYPGTFIIELEDAYQGYSSRVASTISGGESFLVSLSLALALSDIGTGMSVDTLFIDEGFGSLSGEPLGKAVDMLRSLNKKVGRHVGIISHIEDLREKIPVKILVERPAHSSASTVTVGDKKQS